MIKVTFEYATVDEALLTLAKLVDNPAKVVHVPTPATAQAISSARRGRSDKGQARGSYKNPPTIAGAAATAVDTGNGAAPAGAIGVTDTGKAAEQAATPISTVPIPVPVAPAPEPAAPDAVKGLANDVSRTPEAGPAAAAPVYTQKDVQEAVSNVFKTKGLPVALQVLQRFGANTYRDVLPASYGSFIAHATFVSEGGAV